LDLLVKGKLAKNLNVSAVFAEIPFLVKVKNVIMVTRLAVLIVK
jgi:hypothetical protein